MDRSGDYVYQTFDIISLFFLFDLYYRFHDWTNPSMIRTYQGEMDSFNVCAGALAIGHCVASSSLLAGFHLPGVCAPHGYDLAQFPEC